MRRRNRCLLLSLSKPSILPYLKEAAAPVREATGRITGWRAGGHVVFLSTGLANSLVWVCVEVWDSVCRGRSSVGQKTHFSCGAARGNSCFGHSQYYEVLVCWNALTLASLFLLSPSHFAFYTFTSPSPFTFPASSLSVPPSTGPCPDNRPFQSFSSHYNPQLIFRVDLCPLITCLPGFLPLPHFHSLCFFSRMSSYIHNSFSISESLSASTAALLPTHRTNKF